MIITEFNRGIHVYLERFKQLELSHPRFVFNARLGIDDRPAYQREQNVALHDYTRLEPQRYGPSLSVSYNWRVEARGIVPSSSFSTCSNC